MTIAEQQERFIWLVHGEGKTFFEVEKELGVPRATLSQWEIDLKHLWQEVAAVRKLHKQKKLDGQQDLKAFYDWFKSVEHNKKCYYCGITESEIDSLFSAGKIETKSLRGRKLELDRKLPNLPYSVLENIVYACFWCNNAKTDTFTHEEFLEIGKVIAKIWKQRIQNDPRLPNQ